jgi:hypothetical protein
MGVVANVGIDQMPKQGSWLGRRTRVCFNYDTSRTVMGTIVREDDEAPFVTIISLDDGRVVLASECQYSPEAA